MDGSEGRIVVGVSGCEEWTLTLCSQCTPLVDKKSRVVRLPRLLLSADARYGLLSEALAGILLGRVSYAGAEEAEIIRRYRFRVIVEELYGLLRSIGSVSLESTIDPLYPPARRAHLLGPGYWRLYKASEGEELRGEYLELAGHAGLLKDGKIDKVRVAHFMKKVREKIRAGLTSAGIKIGRYARLLASRMAGFAPWDSCPMTREYRAGDYVRLPEGVYYEGNAVEAIKDILGDGVECRRPNMISSSFICEGGGGKVVLKRYMTGTAKWVPAYAASPGKARFLLGPRRRFENEYKMLRSLRRAVVTPRVIAAIREWGSPAIVRGFLEGEPVLDSAESEVWALAGRAIATVHRSGFTLGDSNPGNILKLEGGGAAIIDAEQAAEYSDER
ncbi:MAG: hypothetical protein F7C35_03575, partial [Desulfurococcales archaeon]|nr:hypothetical protein [Desulfurococcales archaeon]